MNNPPSTLLIQKALAGDRLAAGQLLEPYRNYIRWTAFQALSNPDDASDVTQQAMVYALLRLTEVRDWERFTGWLRQLTLSLCVDYRRRRGTRLLGEPLTVLNEASEEKDLTQRIALHEALAHLTEAHRTPFLLHYAGGWSIEEVAALLTIPKNTVRSRLMAAKRLLRSDLAAFFPNAKPMEGKQMPVLPYTLSRTHTSLLENAFPGARILTVQNNPEAWQPFNPRVTLVLKEGSEQTVDFREDITPAKAALLPVLESLGIPGPQLIQGPIASEKGWLSLCASARGENLSLWALGGTPHRIRLATERAFEGIERLQGATEALLADPIGKEILRRTLQDEIAILKNEALWKADPWLEEAGAEREKWLADPWFAAALNKVEAVVADIVLPLVYTDYTFFFPQAYRIEPGARAFDEPLGWPGDPTYQENPLAEIVSPFGHFGDPLLGLAMVWVYDCYPFVHTGFVEQFLWRRGVTRREFAPRLVLKALQMVARDLPVTCPSEGSSYWEALRNWVNQGIAWM